MTGDARRRTAIVALALRSSTFVFFATLLGFGLRMPLLADIPPRWDEGWSVAHASLRLGELLTITSADVHPPLYYVLLGAWQQITGVNLFTARYLSVLVSTTAIPLAYVAARVWSRSPRVAVLSAFIMAWLPLGVYYGGVVRMYALAPSFVLLALYSVLGIAYRGDHTRYIPDPMCSTRTRVGDRGTTRATLLFVIGATGAMLTLYHSVWALAAIGLYGLVASRHRQAAGRILFAVGLSVIAYLPWAVYAVPQFLSRAAAETATNIGQQYSITYFIRQGVYDLTLSQRNGDWGLMVIGLTLVIGSLLVGVRGCSSRLHQQILPALMMTFTIVGVAFAARQWAFNARMLIGAVPALALALAWALDALWRRSVLLASLAAVALVGVYFTTSFDFVYRKTLEVFDPYNPNTYHQRIAPNARPSDLVFFNVLSPAGFYALDRAADDPAWSYALTWDPVIEPPERWQRRIADAATRHDRLWLVLYRGLAGQNGDLRGYMDSTFYPARAEWGEEEVFYGLYGVAIQPLTPVRVDDAKWGNIQLAQAEIGATAKRGSVIPVALQWRALEPIQTNYKVFVHAIAPDGRLIAQHDAQPLNDLRPMSSWMPREIVRDNHGLVLPLDYRGKLRLRLGLYNADTGERLKTNSGQDAIDIGEIVVG